MQNGRTPRDLALAFDRPEIVELIDRELHVRRTDEMRDVTVKASVEWKHILKAKFAAPK